MMSEEKSRSATIAHGDVGAPFARLAKGTLSVDIALMARTRGRCLTGMAVLIAFAGCSTTATITRSYGPSYEAEITGSDARFLRVRDGNGYEFAIPREEVADIDHPGNVLFTIGAVTVAIYTPMLIDAFSKHQDEWSGLARALSLTMVASGLAIGLAGLVPYARSKRAAAAFEDTHPVLPVPRPVYPYPFPLPPPAAPPVTPP
jgi:hypothetical protein